MILDRIALFKLAFGIALFAVGFAIAFQLGNYELQVGTSLAMLCVLCWGWNLVGGYMGYPSLATVTFFGVGAYATAIAQIAGVPVFASWLIAGACGGILAAVIGLPLLRLKGHYFAIGTIATVEVCREIANNWEWLTGGAIGLNLPFLEGTAEYAGRFFFLSMLGLAAIAFLLTFLVERTRLGFGLRCIRQNEQAAIMVGVNVFAYKVVAFALSGILCAIAGGIYASMVAFIEPKDAFNLIMTIEVAVMVMLGGMGTLFGPLIGGVFYVVLKEFVWANFINWHSGLLGVVIVAVIYFMPAGILGTDWSRRFRSLGSRAPRQAEEKPA